MRSSGARLASYMLFLFGVCSILVAPTVQAQEAPAKVTVMVYMNGSDLESEGASMSADLQEMAVVGSRPGLLNILVETLGTAKWHTPGINSEANQRWLVTPNNMQLVKDDLGLRRLDDPATLTDFITWSMATYPADKYILVFENHGAGSVDGFGADEQHDNTSLSLGGIQKGVADAVAATGNRFEAIGFDTCLMATLEVASMLSPYADYLVASEELEPGHGWNYVPFMQALVDEPAITGAKLGQIIADGFQAQAIEWEQEQNITLSVTDLSKVAPVVSALEEFVTTASPDVLNPERIYLVAQARSLAEDYGNGHGDASDMVDLGNLAQQAKDAYPEQADKLLAAIREAVVYEVGGPGRPHATGLSIYFPLKDKAGLERKVTTYLNETPFSDVYKQFVLAFGEALFLDAVPIDFVQNTLETHGESEHRGKVQIIPSQSNQVAEIYSVVTTFAEPGSSKLLFIGMDNEVEFDPQSGEILDNFTGEIVTLNGEYISMFFENEGEEYAEYSIPVIVNGEEMDLKVLFNFETGEAEVIGGWTGFDPISHMAAKNLIKIKPGDKIVPLFYYTDVETGEEGYVQGEEFIVKGPLQIGVTDLPAGEYQYGFYVKDLAGNESFSEFTTVAVEAAAAPVPAPNPPGIGVVLNGQALQFDVPPEVRNGRTLVPVRALFEALGAQITWDGATQTVTAVKGDLVIELQIDNTHARARGKTVQLDQEPVVSSGRTLVPLRFVSEALGAEVRWDAETQTIYLTTK